MFKQSKIEILRDSITKVTQILSQKDIRVTQIGTSAYVERDKNGIATSVNLPYLPDTASDDLVNAIQGFVDHEVSHVLFSDAKHAMKAKMKGKKIENLYGYFNDAYAESMMKKQFRGSHRNLNELASFYTDNRLIERWNELEDGGASEQEKLGAMMGAVTRAWSGDAFYEDFMEERWDSLSTVLDKVPQTFIDSIRDISSSEDAFKATQTFLKYIETEDEPPSGSDGDEDNEDSEQGGSGSSGAGKSGEDEDSDDEEGGMSANSPGNGEGEDDDEDEGESSQSPGGGVGGEDPFSQGMNDTGNFNDALNEQIDRELEDNSHEYIALTTEYDVFEPAPTLMDVGKSEEYQVDKANQLREKAVLDVGAASKRLERAFVSQNRTFFEPGKRSGAINPSALFKLKTGDDRVFRKKVVVRAKNTAVSLVIDQSGSMSSSRKLQKAAIAAYALAEVLTRIKIPFEINGFTTGNYPSGINYNTFSAAREKFQKQTGRTSFSREGVILMNSYKSFDERFEYQQKSRLACAFDHSVTMHSNADAESILFCASRLAKRSEQRKCMIVLSDGQPACTGNMHDQNTYLKQVVKNIENSGMDIVGLGVCDDAVKEYYSRNIVFHDADEIAGNVITQLARMLSPGAV